MNARTIATSCAVRQATPRVVQRLVEAVAPDGSVGCEPRDCAPPVRVDHGGESRGVRGDDGVLAQARLRPRPGTPKFEYW